MPYDSMAAWERNTFEFNDAIQARGFSWSGQFSFEYGPGSTISRDDYVPPSEPSSSSTPSEHGDDEPLEQPPRFTDAVLSWSPPASPRQSPPPSPRVDSAISLGEPKEKVHISHENVHVELPPSATPADVNLKAQTKLANRLYAAACAGDLDNIRFLLDSGADINKPSVIKGLYDAFKPPKPGTLSALAGAAGNGQLDACELLLAEGAALNPDMKQSSSAPLHQACKANDLEIARFLLEVGADKDALNCYKTTPLMYTVKYGSPELVDLLLSYKPDMSISSFINTLAIHWAVWPNHERTMERLLEAGADPNSPMGDGSTPLHCAAGSGYTEMVKTMLKYGADPSLRNHDWCTPAKAAEVGGFAETAEILEAAERDKKVRSA